MNKKGAMPEGSKTVIAWVLVALIVALILLIGGILFGNLSGNVGFGQDSASYYNESITFNDSATPANAKGRINGALSNVIVTNATDGEIVDSANYTVSGVQIQNETDEYAGMSVNVSYTVAYDEQGKIDTDNIITNYTDSAVNVAEQLPTVGTITGIALLLLILIFVLVFVITKIMKGTMGATGGSVGGGKGGGRGSSGFKGSSSAEFG